METRFAYKWTVHFFHPMPINENADWKPAFQGWENGFRLSLPSF
jgi:hypothetical protein